MNNIELIENQLKKMYSLKKDLESNKPYIFQKKELIKYQENLEKLNQRIEEYNLLLLKEYQNLE